MEKLDESYSFDSVEHDNLSLGDDSSDDKKKSVPDLNQNKEFNGTYNNLNKTPEKVGLKDNINISHSDTKKREIENTAEEDKESSLRLMKNIKGCFNRSASIKIKNNNKIATDGKDTKNEEDKNKIPSNISNNQTKQVIPSLSILKPVDMFSEDKVTSLKQIDSILDSNKHNLNTSEIPQSIIKQQSKPDEKPSISKDVNLNKFINVNPTNKNQEKDRRLTEAKPKNEGYSGGLFNIKKSSGTTVRNSEIANSINNITEQTIINNNYNININVSREPKKENPPEMKRNASMKFMNNPYARNLSTSKPEKNQEQSKKNENDALENDPNNITSIKDQSSNRRGSVLLRRANLDVTNEKNDEKIETNSISLNISTLQSNILQTRSPVISIQKENDSSNLNEIKVDSNIEELKIRIKEKIIDKIMDDKSEPEEKIESQKEEAEEPEEAEESDHAFESYDDNFDESEENDEIVDLGVEGDYDGSFLKEMLIETNKQFIKDKQTNEEKIKDASALIIYDILSLKIKAVNIYSFLKIQSFNKIKVKDYKFRLLNCFKIYLFRRKEILRTYFRNYKNIINNEKSHDKILMSLQFENVLKELKAEDLGKMANNTDIIKALYDKMNLYLTDKNIIKENKMESNINIETTKTTDIKDNNNNIEKQVKIVSEIPKIPSIPNIPGVPGGNILTAVPTIPKVPGVPTTSIGQNVPNIPTVPGIPNISSVPGIPKNIPQIPGIPSILGNTSVPKIPGLPSVPGIPNMPSVPGIPSLPGKTGIPTMPNGLQINASQNSIPAIILPKPPADTNPKKIFWNLIPKNKLNETFWVKEKLDAKVDYEGLCKYFCEPKKKEEKKENKDEIKKPETNNQVVKILDDKRLMNLGIALAKVTLSNDQLRETIENFQDEKLPLEMIEKIISLAPNSEEIEKLKGFTGDPNLLSHGERFCLTLMNIYKFMNKLECIKYKKVIENDKDEIMNKLKVLNEGLISIKDSHLFKNVLKLILNMGNYLNSDTAKGNAPGVLINTLPMLESVKGIGKEKYTLLDFLILNIKSKEPSLINFYKDFTDLENVLKVDLADTETKIKEFENGLKKLKKEKESLEKEQNKQLIKYYYNFVNELELNACDKFDEILTEQENLNKLIYQTALYFGEDPKQFKVGEFLKMVNDFVENFKKISSKMSAEEAKQLKKQIKEEKNKKDDNKNKYVKDLEKIRKTVARKTIARKTTLMNNMNFNKEKFKEMLKNEAAKSENTSPNNITKHQRITDRTEKSSVVDRLGKLGNKEDFNIKNSKSPLGSTKVKNLNLATFTIPEVTHEREKMNKPRITKARITKFKKTSNDNSFSDEDADCDEVDNDFLMINQPLKINKLSNLNRMHKNLFNPNIGDAIKEEHFIKRKDNPSIHRREKYI